jgi:hypothetical protein
MKSPSTMLIEANFDVAQVSPTLECTFYRKDAEGTPITGKHAGSVVFSEGEEVSIQINAGGDMSVGGPLPFNSFKVIECTITSRPAVYRSGPHEKRTIFAPPSPFESLVKDQPQGATVVLPAADFKDADVHITPEYYRIGQAWSGKLIVGPFKGRRWRLTIMVTALVELEDGTPEMRVYEIDPEGEVDNGGGKGDCEPGDKLAECDTDPEGEVDNGGGRLA